MSRIPGTPEEKLGFLSTLDQKTLPHLVGDILYFLYDHQEVKVVDGPGDGKRDIHSVLPTGSRHLTQCKYHSNVQASVSSDETDELVLALHKFDCKSGLFVTTGKISPQAKREYLDNYPDFKLDFMDGVGPVDAVLSSPILSSIWFDGQSIIRNLSVVNIPIIIRGISTDRSFAEEKFPSFSEKEVLVSFDTGWSSVEDFSPYRPPTIRSVYEQGNDTFPTYVITFSEQAIIHDYPNLIRTVTKHIASQLSDAKLPVTVRFGIPYITSSFAEKAERRSERSDKVKLYHIDPVSFVINKNRKAIYEHKWLLLNNLPNWMFVEEISQTQSVWAGWFNRIEETVFMQRLVCLQENSDWFPYAQEEKAKQVWLKNSLFLVGSKSDIDAFTAELSEDEQPDWECEYGPSGLLVAWFHPIVDLIENREISFKIDFAQNLYEPILPEGFNSQIFESLLQKIREKILARTLSEVSFEKACLISSIAGKNLVVEFLEREYDSAEIYFYYEDIPSPVYMGKRSFTFVRMWLIPDDPTKARENLRNAPLELDQGGKVYFDPGIVRESGKTYLMSSLSYECPSDNSTNEYFETIKQTKEDHLGIIALHIKSLWLEAELATFYFWEHELGFRIERFEGYYALYGKKNAWLLEDG